MERKMETTTLLWVRIKDVGFRAQEDLVSK